eukprot:TRINITY_DN11853_c0_g1_i1.p1 TRINITY_DN11853_c0_g1~~TRINITY_DN11853_c0_g1_i1.p1  ORF type:complete len:222 (-),score=59.51 TRINITY_DN11853_c0_g1_i1:23-616(-)
MNQLVMNYLVIEGYKDAAECFRQETGTDPGIDLSSISDRMEIRSALQSGDVDTAVSKVNDLDPEILESNPTLFFHLQQQRLIELIRRGEIAAAIEFAQDQLAPRGEENSEFLSELERTLTLLAFETFENCPVADLIDHAQRQKTATELNAAILASQSQEREPKLPNLLRLLLWAQTQLDEKIKNYPHVSDFATATLQ